MTRADLRMAAAATALGAQRRAAAVVGSGASVRASDFVAFVSLAAVVVLLTAVPYAFGYLSAPADKQFMGVVLGMPDAAQYLSWARESGHSLLIENKLTPEAGDATFFNLFSLTVGQLARVLGLGPAEALQLIRLPAGALYLTAIYFFVRLVTDDRGQRWVAFLVAALGGGLGWVWVVEKQFTGQLVFPADLYTTEANTLLTITAFPHQAMAYGLLVLILGLSALALERRSFGLAAIAGVLGLALGLQHGYDLVPIYAVVSCTTLLVALRSRDRLSVLGLWALVCGPSAPAALYLLYITRESPIWREVLAQYGNAGVYTPSPPHLLVLIGLPLLLVLFGLVLELPKGLRRPLSALTGLPAREVLLRCWLVVGLLLLYIPTDFQIKMLAAWQVPVAIFATRVLMTRIAPALQGLRIWGRWRAEVALGLFLVLAVLPVNVYLYSWRFVELGRHEYPYYLERDEIAALEWLSANTAPSDVTLSSLTIGQYIPSVTGSRALLAHWASTLDFHSKRRLVARFFDSATSDAERLGSLGRFNVRYVFWAAPERDLGRYEPSQATYLTEVFSRGHTSVYRVGE
jgi:hypothetical protein